MEKMLVTSIFSFSHNVFYPFQTEILFWSYIYFVVSKRIQFGKEEKCAIWERDKQI